MGLDIQGLATSITALGFDLAGNGKVTATLHLKEDYASNKDFITDSDTESGGSDVTVEGILYRSRDQQRVDVTGNTASFMVEGSDTNSSITEADSLTIDSVKWNIEGVDTLPANAAYILRIRR